MSGSKRFMTCAAAIVVATAVTDGRTAGAAEKSATTATKTTTTTKPATTRTTKTTKTKLSVAQRLVAAYPRSVIAKGRKSVIVRGVPIAVDDGRGGTLEQRMLRADLTDQLSVAYPRGCPLRVPTTDPGRLRNERFFTAMYGATPAAVEKSLVPVKWFESTLRVTSVNNVDRQLQKVAAELGKKSSLRKYLAKPGGTFVWRKIDGTPLQSTHSFGIAVDINTTFADYWRWSGAKAQPKFRNRVPCEIASVFEKHGFIWGGKWVHFDTMHFEYRPELLL